jgi:hypothetical protein
MLIALSSHSEHTLIMLSSHRCSTIITLFEHYQHTITTLSSHSHHTLLDPALFGTLDRFSTLPSLCHYTLVTLLSYFRDTITTHTHTHTHTHRHTHAPTHTHSSGDEFSTHNIHNIVDLVPVLRVVLEQLNASRAHYQVMLENNEYRVIDYRLWCHRSVGYGVIENQL